MVDNGYFLWTDDLFFNLLITLKQAGLEVNKLSIKEIEEYGKKIVSYSKTKNVKVNLMLSRANTIRFYDEYFSYVNEEEDKSISLKRNMDSGELITEFQRCLPVRMLLIMYNNEFTESVINDYINNHDNVKKRIKIKKTR